MKVGFFDLAGNPVDKVLTWSSDGHHFVVAASFEYWARDGKVWLIPEGTETDGASTPHVLWPALPPFGKYWKAAILHDRLYRYEKAPKDVCDRLLLEAMEVLGVDGFEGRIIYDGVVAGGQPSFDEDRREQGGNK